MPCYRLLVLLQSIKSACCLPAHPLACLPSCRRVCDASQGIECSSPIQLPTCNGLPPVVITDGSDGSPQAAPAGDGSSGGGSSTGAIVGGVVGGLAVLAAVGAVLLFLLWRRRRRRQQESLRERELPFYGGAVEEVSCSAGPACLPAFAFPCSRPAPSSHPTHPTCQPANQPSKHAGALTLTLPHLPATFCPATVQQADSSSHHGRSFKAAAERPPTTPQAPRSLPRPPSASGLALLASPFADMAAELEPPPEHWVINGGSPVGPQDAMDEPSGASSAQFFRKMLGTTAIGGGSALGHPSAPESGGERSCPPSLHLGGPALSCTMPCLPASHGNLACCCAAATDDAALNAEIDRHLSSAFRQPCLLPLRAVPLIQYAQSGCSA